MPVLKTASPKVSPSAPYDVPRKARPSSRMSSAGRSLIVAVLSMTDPLYDDPGAEDQEHRDRHDAGDRTAPGRRSVCHLCGLSVENGRTAAEERRHHPGGELAGFIRRVATAARALRPVHRPARVRVDEHEVGGRPG